MYSKHTTMKKPSADGQVKKQNPKTTVTNQAGQFLTVLERKKKITKACLSHWPDSTITSEHILTLAFNNKH